MRYFGMQIAVLSLICLGAVDQSHAQGPNGGPGRAAGMPPMGNPQAGWGGEAAAAAFNGMSTRNDPAVTENLPQSNDIEERLTVLERELNQLQRVAYNNNVSGSPAPIVPAADSGSAALDIQLRMDNLENQVRTLTGQIEETQNSITQLTNRMDKVQSDNELRFQQLEGGHAADSGAQNSAANPAAVPNKGAGDTSVPPSASGVLEPPGGPSPVAPEAPASSVGTLPAGTVLEQYKYAFNLVSQRDFKGAEAAFKAFLQKHPNEPLAANARYWLGEIYYARADYASASAAFAEAYQKDPQGPKAAEDLLKLGLSLEKQGRKPDACASFARLDKTFPNAAPALKNVSSHERQQLGC